MSKSYFLLALFALLVACKPAQEEPQNFAFNIESIEPGCQNASQMICAINITLKCTINPNFIECKDNAKNMPKFVFMQDESLSRPATVSYKIDKLKPLEDGYVEVYTTSTCDGNWFGLCNGNIIYVMKQIDGNWTVQDIYAMEL